MTKESFFLFSMLKLSLLWLFWFRKRMKRGIYQISLYCESHILPFLIFLAFFFVYFSFSTSFSPFFFFLLLFFLFCFFFCQARGPPRRGALVPGLFGLQVKPEQAVGLLTRGLTGVGLVNPPRLHFFFISTRFFIPRLVMLSKMVVLSLKPA